KLLKTGKFPSLFSPRMSVPVSPYRRIAMGFYISPLIWPNFLRWSASCCPFRRRSHREKGTFQALPLYCRGYPQVFERHRQSSKILRGTSEWRLYDRGDRFVEASAPG